MSEIKPTCPRCGSGHTVKNGRIHNKKPKHKCIDCGRQFVENPTKKYISPSVLESIDKMLIEKIPLAGIVRVTGVSKKWLQDYVNNLYAQVTQQIEVTSKPSQKLTIECDEAWSFVSCKGEKQWKELALDTKTKEIAGVYIGDRRRDAFKLWHSLPLVYPRVFRRNNSPRNTRCQCAVCYTDFWDSYQGVIPKKTSQTCGKRVW